MRHGSPYTDNRTLPGANYGFALKGNQGTRHADVSTFLDDPRRHGTPGHATVDGDHGRIETRTSTVSTDISGRRRLRPRWLREDHQWPGLAAIGELTRLRETASKTTPARPPQQDHP